MWAGFSAVRLYLQGIRACGPGAVRARWAAFTPVKWANAGALGMVILAVWPVAKSAIEARLCTDLAGKCLPGIKPSGQGWRPDQPNWGKNRRRLPRASVSRSRAGGKAILPVFAPGEADYPAGLAPVTPQGYRAQLHAARALETITDTACKASRVTWKKHRMGSASWTGRQASHPRRIVTVTAPIMVDRTIDDDATSSTPWRAQKIACTRKIGIAANRVASSRA